jgi:hypothetical protein
MSLRDLRWADCCGSCWTASIVIVLVECWVCVKSIVEVLWVSLKWWGLICVFVLCGFDWLQCFDVKMLWWCSECWIELWKEDTSLFILHLLPSKSGIKMTFQSITNIGAAILTLWHAPYALSLEIKIQRPHCSTEYLFGLSIGVKALTKPADEFCALAPCLWLRFEMS